jgi:hypothetical protein
MKFKYLIIFFLYSTIYAQSSDLIIEDGAEFYVVLGAEITSDYITVNEGGSFIAEDPSGVGSGTIIRGDGIIALPVELRSFTSKVSSSQVTLNWITETELNNYGFEVERKSDHSNWQKITFIEGYGNSNSPKEYSYVDKSPIGGSKFQYRLKQIDNDGQFEYSKVIEVELVPIEFALYQNYPNPFNPSTKIRYQLPVESKVVIKIYNILGSEVMELLNEQKESGIYEVEFNADNLSSGTYVYKISADNFVQTKKMVLLK